jgi:hypothetical protein
MRLLRNKLQVANEDHDYLLLGPLHNPFLKGPEHGIAEAKKLIKPIGLQARHMAGSMET